MFFSFLSLARKEEILQGYSEMVAAYKSREEASYETNLADNFHPDFSASRNMEKNDFLCLHQLTCGIFLQQPEWTKIIFHMQFEG